MTSRWNWTWEKPSAADDQATDEQSGKDTRGAPRQGREGSLRRRRAGAAVAVVAIIALLLITIDSRSGHRSPPAEHRSHGNTTRLRLSATKLHALMVQAENRAVDSVLAYTPAVVQGGTKGNELALTFDDGPGPYTPRLVATLNALHVHATFFAIGEEEQYFSAGTRLELRSGDVVGDHTETHPTMALLSAAEQRNQLLEQVYRIELLGGPTPHLFRPPYGSFNATTFKQLRSLHMLMILWSTDTSDYTLPGVAAIVQRALAGAHPGAIILMHDAGGNRAQTIAALPAIVHGLRKRGLHPVTVPRLLLDDPPPPGQPVPTSLAGD